MDAVKRLNHSKPDMYGIDPLLDNSFGTIVKLPAVRNHVVTWEERGRPDYISYKEYKTTELWWVLLVYNKVFSMYDIREGLTLSIPDYVNVMSALNRTLKYGSNTELNNVFSSVRV